MKRRAVRVMVVLVLVAVATAATHQIIMRSGSIGVAQQRLMATADAASRADLALTDVAASQRSYVAPGQGLDFWAGRVDQSLAAAREAVSTLRSTATVPTAAAQADSARSRLEDFAVMDRRVRDYVRDDRLSMASDLIFADGYEIVAAARSDLSSALSLERAGAAIPFTRDQQVHLASVGALAACAVIAALLLLRVPKADQPSIAAAPVSLAITSVVEPQTLSVADDSIGAALDASLDGLEHTLPAAPASSAVDLSSAADVCVDLGRLLDARDLQGVLGGIADVLSADGLIVWLADSVGQSLLPALTHGYAPALVARFGPLSVEEDNATAAAWRTKALQVVDGALAVPLLTAEGCTGVLAVELRNEKERASDVQSLARIVAAQLAASVSATSSEGRKAAEA